MQIYIKRENHSEGIWMNLPANQDEIKRIYTELEKMHPSSMIPFVAGVQSDIKALAGCLEDCMPFKDDHMERNNTLARCVDRRRKGTFRSCPQAGACVLIYCWAISRWQQRRYGLQRNPMNPFMLNDRRAPDV